LKRILDVPSVGKISYEVVGDGPGLVQVHGVGTGFPLSKITQILSRNFRCINFHMPGYGESDSPRAPGGVDDVASDVAEFIRVLIGPPTFVHGTSFGGIVSLSLAANHPDVVERLVVTSALPRADQAALHRRRLWATVAALGKPELYGDLLLETGFARAFWERPETPALLEEIREDFRASPRNAEAWVQGIASLQDFDGMDFAGDIKAPTLCISGSEDIVTPAEPAASGAGLRELSERLPRGEFEIIEGAGHYVLLEKPEEVAQLIVEFLTRKFTAVETANRE
jgi:3-oxoadipate enol-lactonase